MNKNLLAFGGTAFLLVTAGAVGQASMPGAGVEPDGLAAGSVATCSLPAHYAPLIEVTVTITVTPDAGVVAQAIQDAPPAGWTVRAASITEGGIWDGATGRVKWGPFFDNTARTLQYAVTPPAGATGTAVFVGTASFDGVNQAIGGSRTITPIPPTPVITWANPSSIVYGTLLSATQLNASASVPGEFVYTPGAGTKLNAGVGQTLLATFTPTDTTNYSTASKTVTIDVTKAAPVITWANPSSIVYGTLLSATQLNASASVPGELVYTPGAGIQLTAGVGQTLLATFTPTETTNYSTATKTVSIDVTKATPVITWANPAAITCGMALCQVQLNATANAAGSFLYEPPLWTVLNAGVGQTLSVTFTPTDTTNYLPATKSVTIDVTKATPVITWANPAAITRGTALSGVQLNATASVAGVLVYTPVSGTVLAVGTHTLSTTLTPTDTANYTTATKTVTIDVTSGANPPAFTDDPLQPGVTPAKVVHLTELRQAINTLRAQFNLGSFAWTDATLLPGVTAIKAVHLVELRAALDAVYVAAGRLVPTYTHTTVTGGATVITALDIAELRAAVLAIW